MINITVHCQIRMKERGIGLPDVVACLKDGTKRPSKYTGHPDVWRSRTDDRTVVYAKSGDTVTLLTTY